ncbi:hypothetical protein B0O80DRAFT_210208 [Mortierella sp. GBAus27b]|nr:hypothetical protein BGX31_009814 [Mortierella sp. GBA43]KAI8347762.1 hypothetical protein B0O80DRAFT_210208 [Mortierella sp. GBAus27b]
MSVRSADGYFGLSEDDRNGLKDTYQIHETRENSDTFQRTAPMRMMERNDEKLRQRLSLGEDLREQLQHFNQQQQNSNRQIAMVKERVMAIQRKASDNVSTRNSIRSECTVTYDMNEHPIPRLSIVLPTAEVGMQQDKTTGLIAEHFQLYFLCECDPSRMSDGSKEQHMVHLAKHEAYDLDNSGEFVEKYGSYLASTLQMVQSRITASGSGAQPTSDLMKDLIAVLNCPEQDVGPLVNSTIEYLQTQQKGSDDLSTLESEYPGQLSSYLRIKDDELPFSNLRRIVTQKGHTKWLCLEHYRTRYQNSSSKQLLHVIRDYNGYYDETTDSIKIKLKCDFHAGEFYRALASYRASGGSRGISELDITLEWDATMNEIQDLASAITLANVVYLTVDGTYFKNPTLDVVNRKRRFDPIMQLAANERIQSLKLRGFEAFFHRVTPRSFESSSKPNVFSMDSGDLLISKHMGSFNDFLKPKPPLTALKLRLGPEYSLSKTTMDILGALPRLQSLSIDYGGMSMASRVADGRVQDVDLTVERVDDLSNEFKFIQPDQLTRLAIKRTSQKEDESYLLDILEHWTRLEHLRIGCKESRALAVVNIVLAMKAQCLSLRTFELKDETQECFEELRECDDSTYIHTHISFSEDVPSFDMKTWIRLGNRMSITDKDPIYDFARQYGWSIIFLEENWTYNDTFAAILDNTHAEGRVSRLETLSFEVSKLTASGFERLNLIIQQSPNFKRLGLRFELASVGQSDTVNSLLKQHGSKLFKLQLCGTSSIQWLQKFALFFPTRNSFPNLESFEVAFDTDCVVPTNCVRWISSMIASPAQVSASSKGMRKIMLSHIRLQPECWKAIINALDFKGLEHLDLSFSNLSQDLFKYLVDRIPGDMTTNLSLKTLNIKGTILSGSDPATPELQRKVPSVQILQAAEELEPLSRLKRLSGIRAYAQKFENRFLDPSKRQSAAST